MTKDELYKNLETMKNANAPQEDLQSLIDTYNSQEKQGGEPGFVQGMAQGITKAPLSLLTTVLRGAEAVGTRLGGGSKEDAAAIISKPVDYGYLGESSSLAKPLTEDTGIGGIIRASAGVAGAGLEIYSLAPLRGGLAAGALNIAKAQGIRLGAGIGLQKYGETGDVGKAAFEGTLAGASVFGGSLAFSGLGALASRYGGRLLESSAVRSVGQQLGDFVDTTKQIFQTVSTPADREAIITALTSEFDSLHKSMTDKAIDTLMPAVENKWTSLRTYKDLLNDTVGKLFTSKNELYDSLRSSDTKVPGVIDDAISYTQGLVNQIKGRAGAHGSEDVVNSLQNLILALKSKAQTGEPVMNDILNLHKTILTSFGDDVSRAFQQGGESTKVSSELQTALTSIAQRVYTKTKDVLSKGGTESADTLRMFNQSYEQFLGAQRVYSHPVIQSIMKGDTFDVVKNILGLGVNDTRLDVVREALTRSPESADMLIAEILRQAKGLPTPKEGAVLIDNFMEKLGQTIGQVRPKAPFMLQTLSGSMKDEFSSLLRQFGNDGVQALETSRARSGIVEAVMSGKLGDVASSFNNFLKTTDTPLDKIDLFSPQEKQLVGAGLAKDLLDGTIKFAHIKNGVIEPTEELAESVIKFWSTLQNVPGGEGAQVIEKIFGKNTIGIFEKAHDFAQQFLDLKEGVPHGGTMKSFLHYGLGALQAIIGWQSAALHSARRGTESMLKQGSPNFYPALEKAIKDGGLKTIYSKSGSMLYMGDLLKWVGKVQPASRTPGEGIESLITNE